VAVPQVMPPTRGSRGVSSVQIVGISQDGDSGAAPCVTPGPQNTDNQVIRRQAPEVGRWTRRSSEVSRR
jgi:hypothetical protein